MNPRSFTLIDAFNQYWTVCGDDERRALSCAGLTYFYLCKVWNAAGRPVSFRRQNAIICAELFISRPTLEKHRNELKNVGLIDFHTKGRGNSNIQYKILDRGANLRVDTMFENSPQATDNVLEVDQQSVDALYIVVGSATNNYKALLMIFEADPGLQVSWLQQGMERAAFGAALERWMIQNNGHCYANFVEARKHFLFWMPHYNRLQKGEEHVTKVKAGAIGRKDNEDYSVGL